MGRIDDALRRAAVQEGGAAPTVARAKAGVFVSPWAVADEPVSGHQEPSPAHDLFEDDDLRSQSPRAEWAHVLVDASPESGHMAEQFRRLAGNLHSAQVAGKMKLVMVTSAQSGDGKTLTSVNLALILSGSFHRRVLLIDADLRRPSIADIYRLSDRRGLSEALKERADQKLPVIRLKEGLTLLPAGRPDPDPMSGLSSERMQRILQDASERFDWIVVDAPPVGIVPDATILAPEMDAVLFVVRAGKTPYSLVEKAIDAVGRDRIFGVVLNAVDADNSPSYGGYYGGEPTRRT